MLSRARMADRAARMNRAMGSAGAASRRAGSPPGGSVRISSPRHETNEDGDRRPNGSVRLLD